jgi:2-polyprenyl-6-methoxyphenol hydroxylase-like FAD-dependent oxidoreductase
VELVRRGVDFLLIDAHDAPLDWDRPTVMHTRSIEVFEALGLSEQLLDNAVKVRGALLHSDGRMLGKLDLGLTQSRYGFDLVVSEEVTESVLTAYLTRCGGEVTRSARLLDIERAADHVVATVERNGGPDP